MPKRVYADERARKSIASVSLAFVSHRPPIARDTFLPFFLSLRPPRALDPRAHDHHHRGSRSRSIDDREPLESQSPVLILPFSARPRRSLSRRARAVPPRSRVTVRAREFSHHRVASTIASRVVAVVVVTPRARAHPRSASDGPARGCAAMRPNPDLNRRDATRGDRDGTRETGREARRRTLVRCGERSKGAGRAYKTRLCRVRRRRRAR